MLSSRQLYHLHLNKLPPRKSGESRLFLEDVILTTVTSRDVLAELHYNNNSCLLVITVADKGSL